YSMTTEVRLSSASCQFLTFMVHGFRMARKAVHGTALAHLTKEAARDRPDGNGLIDGQSLLEAQGRTGAPGLVEEPDDFVDLVIVQLVGDPLLIGQLGHGC